jgi:opacity protein-like surface antigen
MRVSKTKMLAAMLMAGVLLAAAPAAAQTTPRIQASAGYQFLHLSGEGEGESLGKGWYGEVAGNLTPMFSAVVEVSGSYKSIDESLTVGGVTSTFTADVKLHQFLGGVRVNSRRNPAIIPFGQVLFGGVNGSVEGTGSASVGGSTIFAFSEGESSTEFAMLIGGGADFRLNDKAGIRLGAGYTRIFGDGGANAFRVTAGVVFPFAR